MFKNITLFSLQTFSTTGGIQKMTRTLAHSLYNICLSNGWQFKLSSLYDADADLMPQYLPKQNFSGFSNRRLRFIFAALFNAKKNHTIILSHINLAVIGLLIKAIRPKTKMWVIAHGIEVWRPLPFHKALLLTKCDNIICVSAFTKSQMQHWHKISAAKCVVINNVLDPFMELPLNFDKPETLLKRYGLVNKGPVVFTLTRLASTEHYKGHDRVIRAIAGLKNTFPEIRYVLAGKYDNEEGVRVKQLINRLGVAEHVILPGFIKEDELAAHFLMADLFVLPSKKEGFGIVFIEALACGLPVICGNADGSIDAIRNGELGTAINPDNDAELEKSIAEHLAQPLTLARRKHLKSVCLHYFTEQTYISALQKMLIND
ncbi:glycosyltransferase family 4 protein [Mucilaginibacter sp. 14171R-50]|uniref:glycosyltransferase family 4 protein n=1 Tax=Mucilaginibacter sp. 14171R-50 TaxID=2703789 RepID=UPI00138BB1E2|nr:glycosyltransferase family 4 protein [Mucilaginibacter sp. 14171R-50]QHS56352.1 glycosyltransferase family 4 protein [Mucilaginibacter sp. 14171R-50]